MTTKKAKDFCGEVDKTEDEITQKNKRTQFFKDNVYDDNNIDLVNDLDIDRLQNYCDQYKSTDSNIDKSNAKNIIERYDGSFCDNKFHSRDYRSNKKIFCSKITILLFTLATLRSLKFGISSTSDIIIKSSSFALSSPLFIKFL